MSGTEKLWLPELNHLVKLLKEKERGLEILKSGATDKKRDIEFRKKDKMLIAIIKPQIKELKKLISQVKKHIK